MAQLHDTPLRFGVPAREAARLCVFVHGRGQTPEEMVAHVLGRLPDDDTHFILPRAPGGAWYDARAVDPASATTLAQLEAALDAVDACIAMASADGVPAERPVLAGFSQGACVVIEHAMRRNRPLGALAALTGCRVGPPTEASPRRRLDGLPVYLSGSDADPWIPASAAFAAAADLAACGARLRAESFPGRDHAVCDAEIEAFAVLLTQVDEAMP
ncbi:alpha/beta hydrolase [Aquibium microcysteis]|uniref:alpha/beta hydrolase n=1 Tax=Aquibium microcysteis TaxID=675281 RepID=UPI001EF2705D|nr:dienelactone hydrolase family protein [Aquibium microcysteis]